MSDAEKLDRVYRARRAAYPEEVSAMKGVVVDEISGIGFVLDAVIGQLASAIAAKEITATDEMAALIARFVAVKKDNPKP